MTENEELNGLNLFQKLARIRRSVGALKKNKSGFGYKYVSEDEILAKVTAGMDKYGISLIPQIKPGTAQVLPHQYIDKKGKQAAEIIVSADMGFRWINNDNPEEYLDIPWLVVGQQADAAQAFGSGLTYTNRYFLLKYFQMATVEDDPDAWRAKKKQAAEEGDADELADLKAKIISAAQKKIEAGKAQEDIYSVIAEHTGGKKNPNSIKSIEVAQTVLNIIENMEV